LRIALSCLMAARMAAIACFFSSVFMISIVSGDSCLTSRRDNGDSVRGLVGALSSPCLTGRVRPRKNRSAFRGNIQTAVSPEGVAAFRAPPAHAVRFIRAHVFIEVKIGEFEGVATAPNAEPPNQPATPNALHPSFFDYVFYARCIHCFSFGWPPLTGVRSSRLFCKE
jgi:hypothetical protein